MAQGEGFKHITVTAPEEEDVVILAGMASSEPAEEAQGVEAAVVDDEVVQPEEVPQPKEVQSRPVKHSKPKADAYQETTLEDLKSTPMPFAQRVVIIAAIVCIIGAVIYCAVFMG